jgi:hypothetical protein
VAFVEAHLQCPNPDHAKSFQHYPPAHEQWPGIIPPTRHLYLNKLWHQRAKYVS